MYLCICIYNIASVSVYSASASLVGSVGMVPPTFTPIFHRIRMSAVAYVRFSFRKMYEQVSRVFFPILLPVFFCVAATTMENVKRFLKSQSLGEVRGLDWGVTGGGLQDGVCRNHCHSRCSLAAIGICSMG